MNKEILNTGILAALFFVLFGVSEFLYKRLKIKAAFTRNIVHFGTGMLTLLFPLMLTNYWSVFFLCASFAIILIISLKLNFLKSINAINRISYGSVLYPIAVYGCYLVYYFSGKDLILFYLPILILAISDPIAALTGKRWPMGRFYIGRNEKTLMGFISFFISSIIVTIIAFSFLSPENLKNISLIILIAAAGSIVEAISVRGIDNITIPATVILILFLSK